MSIPTEQFSGIDKALRNGLVLNASRRGSGLRCVRIDDRKGKNKGYGDMPQLRPALIVADKDYQAGCTEYEVHYLTGSSEAEDNLDLWILKGNELHAEQLKNGLIRLEARDYKKNVIDFAEAVNFAIAYEILDSDQKRKLQNFKP